VWPAAALAVVLVIVSAGALFVWLRPDLPPATNLPTVSQLVVVHHLIIAAQGGDVIHRPNETRTSRVRLSRDPEVAAPAERRHNWAVKPMLAAPGAKVPWLGSSPRMVPA
jgi:hypothetical protein